MSFYALRYLPLVPLTERKHAPTLGRFTTWIDADDAREALPNKTQLEIVVRGEES